MKKILLVILLSFFINYSFCQLNTILKLNGNVLKYGDFILYKPFNPMDLQPTVWLNGSSVVKDGSNYVSQWNDLSGNENHAVQVAGANQPLYVADGGDEFNYPVIRFDGSNDFLNGTTIPNLNTSSISIFIVVKGRSQSNNAGFFDVNSFSNGFQFKLHTGVTSLLLANNGTYINGGILPITGFNFKILEGIKNYTIKTELFINSLSVGSSTNSSLNGSFTNNNYVIGKDDGYLNGDIAEIILFKKELTEVERINVERYLNAKYNIY